MNAITLFHGSNEAWKQIAEAPLKPIVVPLDPARECSKLLRVAEKLAFELKARLVLLHAVQLNILGEEYGYPRTQLVEELCQERADKLQEKVEKLGSRVPVDIVICEGPAAEVIVDVARDLGAEMVVAGCGDRKSKPGWFSRNIVPMILQHAPCKVMLVESPKPETFGLRKFIRGLFRQTAQA